ncbi:hypothetical protein CYFUS_000584 [Cystobacter fuscus]|uniref:NACHT domain-containing protein n=1 Tax=Cystobacter fuscus TaxID=43 RepID=A0A250IVA2_9BACT|nr:hypothetical protein [Cystobacter fuscus]ATB35172.1 hypothetical protein CYFUS_000584 [Cystobacter fuscus]
MKTSPRAGSPTWRSLLRRAPWLASAVLLGFVGCARSEQVPAPVEASVAGYWVRPFSRASRLAPCGHGNHVWAWTPQRAGLGLVDADGGELSVRLGDENARVVDVIPSADPERAWVHVEVVSPEAGRANAVYSVDHQGSLQRIDALPSQELVLAPSEGHERLWVVSLFTAKTLWVIDPAGGVEAVALSIPGQASAAVGRATLVPVGDGRQGWLVLDQNLHQVDLQAKSKFNPRPLSARNVRELIPTSRAQRVWVLDSSRQTAPRLLQTGREGAADKNVEPSPPLPDTVQRPFVHQRGDSLWLVVPEPKAAKSPGSSVTTPAGLSLKLVTPEGPVGSGVQVEGAPLIAHSPDGAAWARDEHRVYRLGDTGDELARSKSFSDVDALLPVSAEQAWIVSRDGFVRLLSMKDSALVVTASDPTNLRAPVARAWDAHGVWFVSDEETRLHRLRLGPEGLSLSLVLEGVDLGDVRPISGTERFWIAGTPRSYVQAPVSEVRRVEVGFAGGAVLERGAEGAVQMTGTPEAGAALSSLEVDWPGLVRAKGLESGLRIEVRDENGNLVGQGLRRFVEPEGLLFQWTEPPGSTEHLYDLQVSSPEVENGSRLTASFRHVPFGVPLLDQVWVRTALACVGLTLLLLLPLLLLRPSAAPRRWLPLLGYSVSLVGAGGSEVLGLLGGLRIHLPTVVGVVSAEVVLCACLGLLSPVVFRKLVFTHPFSWAAAPLLRSPAFRRRFFATHVRQVRRRVEVASAQANGEVFVDLSAHVVEHGGPGVPPSPSERTAAELCLLLTHERAHLLIQCAGGRGKSALLRQLVRLSLERFEQRPSSPLPVFIDPAAEDLESAAKEALQDLGLPEELRNALLESGDFFLVLDGLTESRVEPEALRRYLEREMGLHAPLLLSARPNEAYRLAMSHSLRWMAVEPKRLDEAGLARFQAAYPDEKGQLQVLSGALQRICRGRGGDGTYVPLLVRLALRFGGGGVDSVINLYRSVFAGLLKRDPDDAATSEMLAFAEALCLDSYWEHRSRLIVFRDSPDEHKLQGLLDAGLLVPADARPGPVPTHVRFFHDSMQSYLTARALYARQASQARWDCLWRAAGEPGFAREQSDLMTEAGSELFQMCAYVFGYDARLKAELARHLELCAEANDERLTKEGILAAVPGELREMLRRSGRSLGPGALLREATRVCAEHGEGEALFLLYARIAPRVWPWKPNDVEDAPSRTDAA